MTALRINPNDEHARLVLLDVLKNKNRVLRFFAGNSFNRYQVEWSFWRVVGMVFLWKAVIFWGGLFFLYMMVTWYGSVLYNSVIRLHRKYRYLLDRSHRRQSNYFLALNGAVAAFIAALSLGFINRWLSDGLAIGVLALFMGISFFEMGSAKGQRAVGITAVLFTGLLIWAATSASAWAIPLLAGFLLLLYGFLFSLNVIRD
ncbi:MAG: hypothetical protein AAGB22_00145 [Bacteroidota bacterium]